MRRLLVQIALLAILLIGGYLAIFKRDFVIGLFQKAKSELKGYKEAKTPDEAMDYFNKGLENRDYNEAANYLDGEYAIQFRKVADKAEKLAKAIDNFRDAMETHGIRSSKVDVQLALLELLVFPKRLRVVDKAKTKGDDEAVVAVVIETGSQPRGARPITISLKRVGEQWKIVQPLTPTDRDKFDSLDKHGQDYVNALNTVKQRMKTDATTKEHVARDLEEELKKALKD